MALTAEQRSANASKAARAMIAKHGSPAKRLTPEGKERMREGSRRGGISAARAGTGLASWHAGLTPEQRSALGKKASHARPERESGRSVKAAERELRGNACERCGCADGLVWHHRNPATKSFGLSEKDRSAVSVRAELEKCDLLCRGYHSLVHAEAPARLALDLGLTLDALLDAAGRAGLAWHRA
jgi:hypothetical protein